ncbi:hypothetical protein KKE60_05050, partial [Patescibacteria group bacterium]|nr:hypothetical protein [Patescibacteria group bacterium]
ISEVKNHCRENKNMKGRTKNNDIKNMWKEGPILFAILLFPATFLLCSIFYWIHTLLLRG